MQWKLLTLIPLISIFFIATVDASTHVPTNTYFGFADGCYINFNTPQTFNRVSPPWLNDYGCWYFDSYTYGLGFRVQNANMTITDYFQTDSNKLKYTVTASLGVTSTTKIYVSNKGEPASVEGATSWSYDDSMKILTVNVVHASSANITVTWSQDLNPDIVQGILAFIKRNFYLVFNLISLAPVILAAAIIVGIVKSGREMNLQEILVLVGLLITVAVGFVIVNAILNTIV